MSNRSSILLGGGSAYESYLSNTSKWSVDNSDISIEQSPFFDSPLTISSNENGQFGIAYQIDRNLNRDRLIAYYRPNQINNGYQLLGAIYSFYEQINPETGRKRIDDLQDVKYFQSFTYMGNGIYNLNLKPLDTSTNYATLHKIDISFDEDDRGERNFRHPTIQELESSYPGISRELRRGDMIENSTFESYRASNISMVDIVNSELRIISTNDEIDDYGSPSKVFQGLSQFPLNYWDSNKVRIKKWVESDNNFYWHSENPPILVKSRSIGLSNLRSSNFAEISYTQYSTLSSINETLTYYYTMFSSNRQNYLLILDELENINRFDNDEIYMQNAYFLSNIIPNIMKIALNHNIPESNWIGLYE